jgi:hypothetical protein
MSDGHGAVGDARKAIQEALSAASEPHRLTEQDFEELTAAFSAWFDGKGSSHLRDHVLPAAERIVARHVAPLAEQADTLTRNLAVSNARTDHWQEVADEEGARAEKAEARAHHSGCEWVAELNRREKAEHSLMMANRRLAEREDEMGALCKAIRDLRDDWSGTSMRIAAAALDALLAEDSA